MKKILILIAIIGTFTACNEKEPTVCNCGLILDDDASNYSIKIRNECSGNEKWFILQRGDWMNAYVGSNYCITNVDGW